MDDRPLYSSRILNTYINFVKRNYPAIDINELLSHAGVESYQVADEGHWFTQAQHDRFHEKLVELTGNKNIAHEVGRFSASPDAVGLLKQYAIGLLGPANVFQMIGNIYPKFSRSSTTKFKKISSNSVEITINPREDSSEKPYQCENRLGMFELTIEMFNYKAARVEHTECIFKGGRSCTYLISWQQPKSLIWKKARNITSLIFIIAAIGLIYFHSWIAVGIYFPVLITIILLMTYHAERLDKEELNSTLSNLRSMTERQIDQIDINYKNALMINEIGQAVSKKLDINAILLNIMHTLEQRLDYDRGMILLANEDRTRLHYAAGFGLDDEKMKILKEAYFHLDRPESRGVFVLSFREQRPILVNDMNNLEKTVSSKSLEILRGMGSQSFVCCPIIYETESMGVLVVDNVQKKRELTQTDISLLTGIAPQIGISIHNARMVDNQKKQFNSILRVMAASIDARDPLTAGHSEEVTEYAVGISRILNLDDEFCEMIGIAGLLHDYGKIGVRDDVLKKPGQLTNEEYDEIRSHVEQTRRILDKMEFDGIFKEIPSIAGFHHEKVDGTGYPLGLKGEAIPLGARIIAVADVFEALTAKRHYREPMKNQEALEIIQKGAEKSFDPKVVAAFGRYYQTYIGDSP